ncbi:hypothetical protein AC578_8382 [Pseudocercospora eumusae]|uniref:Aminotransferase class V domain-containing protein n=1 Tax=Pseudocercospora eumusae TaxID=321146 RepID=A0A139HS77_9PEZI|nr:hypothetical protein AC578_8382 [Pseudocercospora eumusae]KXT05259.1 hypothetical protein AC578_8382 [Pseudocercospora eumusae]KXT05260.1 hypothetical protein AC578_8382 [Pseudocercospora eumusae]
MVRGRAKSYALYSDIFLSYQDQHRKHSQQHTATAMSNFDIEKVRSHFPALGGKQIYFDNAGGSQVLREVIDSIVSYLSSNNVQLGASYPISQKSTDLFYEGSAAVAKYINTAPENVVLGPSTTQLFRNLSISLYDYIDSDSEIIVSLLDHEANIASWVQLAKDKNCKLIWWGAESKTNPQLSPSILKGLLSPKTKLVTCTHTSNILGTISPIKEIAETVHTIPGALLCVDAVAYAPHRAIDVQDLGVDFYSFSWYKLYGPHIASLYASPSAQKHLRTLGHFFKDTTSLENLLGLAAANYELTASLPHVCKYISELPWSQTSAYEEQLQEILITYLLKSPEIYQIYGEPSADRNKRVPVISFTVKGRKSQDVVEKIEAQSDYGCRWGSFYSNRLAENVCGLDPVDGIVRVSLLHYNTREEVEGFVKVLDAVVRG